MKNLANFIPCKGLYSETTTNRNLLKYLGFDFSEAMVYGLGEGFDYNSIRDSKQTLPIISGFSRTGNLTKHLATNLKLNLKESSSFSPHKALQQVTNELDMHIPVGIQLDGSLLEYIDSEDHIYNHTVCAFGYNKKESTMHLADIDRYGNDHHVSLESLAAARSAKITALGQNRSFTLTRFSEDQRDQICIAPIVDIAVYNNSMNYINPRYMTTGCKGILKTVSDIVRWINKDYDINELHKVLNYINNGNSKLFIGRQLYSDFLKEAAEITDKKTYRIAYERFRIILELWADFVYIIQDSLKNEDKTILKKSTNILKKIYSEERNTMELFNSRYFD